MKRRNFFSTLLAGALGLVGMSQVQREERVADRLRRRLEELRAKPPLSKMILRTSISYEEIERARSGGAKYFCEKLEETAMRDLKSNLKMVQRDLGA